MKRSFAGRLCFASMYLFGSFAFSVHAQPATTQSSTPELIESRTGWLMPKSAIARSNEPGRDRRRFWRMARRSSPGASIRRSSRCAHTATPADHSKANGSAEGCRICWNISSPVGPTAGGPRNRIAICSRKSATIPTPTPATITPRSSSTRPKNTWKKPSISSPAGC